MLLSIHVCSLWEEGFIHNPQENVFFDKIKSYRHCIDDIDLHFQAVRLNTEYSEEKIYHLDRTIHRDDDNHLHATLFHEVTDLQFSSPL